MNKDKNARGQQNQGQQGQGSKDREWKDTSHSNTNREPAEGGRGQNAGNRGNPGGPERGAGNQGERNSSGISNRGMNRSEEQADLPSRGSSNEDLDNSSDEDWNDKSER